eukprot:4775944-Prymnesium_polylepis.1
MASARNLRLTQIRHQRAMRRDPSVVVWLPRDDVAHEPFEARAPLLHWRSAEGPEVAMDRH